MLDQLSTAATSSGSASAAPLVFLPGTLCDERVFAPVLGRLDRRARVLPILGADTAEQMADRILFAAPERMSLCGFSLGAVIALEIIARAPKRVERLALIGCNPGVLSPEEALARAALTQTDFLSQETSRYDKLLRDMAQDTLPEVFAQQTAITLSRPDSRPRLGRIDVPTLVLCGADDRFCPPHLSRGIGAAVSNAHLAIIEGAGHYVTLDRPGAVASELVAWLARPRHHPY